MSKCENILNEQVKSLRAKNAELELKLKRYDQAPRTPFIKGGTCNTTHSACDCVIKRTGRLEAAYKHAMVGLNGILIKCSLDDNGNMEEELIKHIAECEEKLN